MINLHRRRTRSLRSGFTIIEVSLATALMSVLLIAISVITINIISIYQKGITIKNLNSVGRNLLDDIETAINASLPAEAITSENHAFEQQYYKVAEDGNAGVFCAGQYSYIWAKPNTAIQLLYNGVGSSPKTNIRLLKVKDWRRQVCINYDNSSSSHTIDIRRVNLNGSDQTYDIPDEPEELLTKNEVDLYIYRFVVNEIDSSSQSTNQSSAHTGEVFFSGEFTLGTERGVDTGNLSSDKCQEYDSTNNDTESERAQDFNYCAINTFKFAARTAGKVEK